MKHGKVSLRVDSLRSNNNCAVQKNHFLFSHLNVFSHFFREVSWKIVATTNSRPNCFADLIGPPTTHCPLYYLRLYLMPLPLPWQREKNPISQLFIEWTAMVNLNENNPVVAFCCVVSCFSFVQLRLEFRWSVAIAWRWNAVQRPSSFSTFHWE